MMQKIGRLVIRMARETSGWGYSRIQGELKDPRHRVERTTVSSILKDAGVDTVLTPYRAPNCNAFAERFVRSIKEECLGRTIFFGESSLLRAIQEYVEHCHFERPHQGLGNKVIERAQRRPTEGTGIRGNERLGGLLRHYSYAA